VALCVWIGVAVVVVVDVESKRTIGCDRDYADTEAALS